MPLGWKSGTFSHNFFFTGHFPNETSKYGAFSQVSLDDALRFERIRYCRIGDYDNSKDTYTLAYDPSLSTLSNRVRVDYPPRNAGFGISIWGTCNGLICVTPYCYYNAVLWNPATNEFKEVPTVPNESGNDFSYCYYAFGYDDEIDDFKVGSFVGSEDYGSLCEVQVYTLKSNSWRRLENIPWEVCAGDLILAQVTVNGATHWLVSYDSKPDKVIASFDFRDESFNEMLLPRSWDEYAEIKLCSLGGSLCLHGSVVGRIDVWEMKEYKVTETWAKLFTVNEATICRFSRHLSPLQFVKNSEVLLGYDTDVDYHLDLYDIKLGTSTNLKAYATGNSYYAATFVYVESLVTLNSGTYVVQPEIERKRLHRRGMAELQDPKILLNILVRLPVKSILRFRCVSKVWCKYLEDPKFVKKHLNHAIERNIFSVMMHSGYGLHKSTYTLDFDPSTSELNNRVNVNYPSRYKSEGIIFWGTCNGLVCVSPHGEDAVVLWNPATREYINVPVAQIELCPDDIISYLKYGFGYDDEIDDFKVVTVAGFEGESCCEVQVYTLGSDSWRRIEDIPYEFGFGEPDMARVSVNGAMHWIVKTDPMASETYKVIVSFDFKDDQFNEMPLPSFCDEYSEANLCSLGGSLCLLGSMHQGRIDVWQMKDYGVTESWAKFFTVEQATICEFFGHLIPLQLVKNGEVLLGYDTGLDFCLDLYDLKRGTSINLKAHDDFDSYSSATSVYVESLVSLNSGTYVGKDDDSEDDDSEDDESEDEDNEESEDEDSEDGDDSEEEEQQEEYIETKRERLRRWGISREVDLGILNSGTRAGRLGKGDSEVENLEADDNSNEEEEEEEKEEETRKLDMETRKLDFEIRVQEDRHMSMDKSKIHPSQLKWWQMRANQIAEKYGIPCVNIGDVNDGKEEEEDCNGVEEDIENKKKKVKLM